MAVPATTFNISHLQPTTQPKQLFIDGRAGLSVGCQDTDRSVCFSLTAFLPAPEEKFFNCT